MQGWRCWSGFPGKLFQITGFFCALGSCNGADRKGLAEKHVVRLLLVTKPFIFDFAIGGRAVRRQGTGMRGEKPSGSLIP